MINSCLPLMQTCLEIGGVDVNPDEGHSSSGRRREFCVVVKTPHSDTPWEAADSPRSGGKRRESFGSQWDSR